VLVVASIVAALMLALAAASPAAAAERYTVQPRDTLFSIARRFHVPLALLARVNGIRNTGRIRAGDLLIIPDVPAAAATDPVKAAVGQAPRTSLFTVPIPSRHGAPAPSSLGAAGAAAGESYIVRAGDTVYHLALTHGTTVEALEAANGLTSPAITVGQMLRIPAPPRGSPAPGDLNAPRLFPEPAPVEPAPSVNAPLSPARTALAARLRASALGYLGTPYRWGGTTPAGVDCSGLVYLVYSPYVANLPRTSYEQWTAGVAVDRAELEPGDLVFFNTDGTGASHVGIYIGDGQFVHPAASTQRVVVDRLDNPYFVTHYLGARRLL
jgi:peptidoglycan endopeptidase LytE